jgi:short-subunit dehydrogenase
VRVNAVAAGLMLTEWSQGFTEEKLKKVRERNVLKKITDVEDVALQYVSLIENGSMTVSTSRTQNTMGKADSQGQVIQVNSSM